MSRTEGGRACSLLLFSLVLLAPGCRLDMHDQPRVDTFRVSPLFEDRMASRPVPPGTVAQGQLREDELLYTGRTNGRLSEVFPFPVTREVLERGRERFDIFCSPCHGHVGDGNGVVPQRGFRRPPSFHIERLRQAPAGHLFDVITNGFGAMYDYRTRVAPRDRWAIAAYIRVLQASQDARLADVPQQERPRLEQE